MTTELKRVPAIDKCFAMLELFSRLKKPLGVSEISKALNLNKSTVFNIVHTLDALGVLEKKRNSKFVFGTQLYILGKAAGRESEFINTVHPYLEEINEKTKLSAFLGIRAGMRAVIMDKVDTAFDIKIHSEIGMRIPLLAGAGGRALLSQLPDSELDNILSKNKLEKFTPYSCKSKKKFKKMIKAVRYDGVAVDREEYIEGIRAIAVPLIINRNGLYAAIWTVGLKRQIKDGIISQYSKYLKKIAKEIERKLTSGWD